MDEPKARQALTELQARARGHLQRAVGQALPALAAPDWPVAVVATASALVAGRAEAAAAQRLIAEVQAPDHVPLLSHSHPKLSCCSNNVPAVQNAFSCGQ